MKLRCAIQSFCREQQQNSNGYHTDLVTQYPDVVVASENNKGAQAADNELPLCLHFAPATVQHLLETERFASLNSECLSPEQKETILQSYPSSVVKKSVLGSLYVAVRSTEKTSLVTRGLSPLHGGILVPIPDCALDELVSSFLVRNVDSVPLIPVPSALTLFDRNVEPSACPGYLI